MFNMSFSPNSLYKIVGEGEIPPSIPAPGILKAERIITLTQYQITGEGGGVCGGLRESYLHTGEHK